MIQRRETSSSFEKDESIFVATGTSMSRCQDVKKYILLVKK